MKKIFSLCWLYLIGMSLQAQYVNNDCFNVLISNRLLTTDATFTQDNLNGKGDINDFGVQYQNSGGCLAVSPSGWIEAQSAWYGMKIKTSGTLTFTIGAIAAHDFDFAIFGPNKGCNTLGTPIRCSYASPKAPNFYQTGLNFASTDFSEDAGGDGFVKSIDVQAGDFYYLLVNNWSNVNVGFHIEFGGTATMGGQTAEITNTTACNAVSFSANPGSGLPNELSYVWNFGDGKPATALNTQANPTYIYDNGGTYSVSCQVTFTNPGRTFTVTKDVVVESVGDFIGLENAYCINSPSVPLTATPTGGFFKINSVAATTFDPSLLGAGTHTVTYNYINATNLCTSIKTKVVTIHPLPSLEFVDLEGAYCINSVPVPLSATPAGGVFKVNQVSLTTFDPATFGVGTHTLSYNYTSAQGCTTEATKTITVNPLPVTEFVGLNDSYPYNAPTFALQANPAGGIFKINNLNATTFDATTLGIGTHEVGYIFTNANGCSATITKAVQVTPPAPMGLIATPVFPFMMQLQWANVVQETGYSVWSSTTQGTGFQQIGTTAANVTTFLVNNLVAGQSYYFMVKSFNGSIISSNSNEVAVVATALENTNLHTQITLSPNPTEGICTIRVPDVVKGEITCTLFDEAGKDRWAGKVNITDNQTILDLSKHAKGTYILRLQTNKGEIWKKIILL